MTEAVDVYDGEDNIDLDVCIALNAAMRDGLLARMKVGGMYCKLSDELDKQCDAIHAALTEGGNQTQRGSGLRVSVSAAETLTDQILLRSTQELRNWQPSDDRGSV